MNSLSMLFAVAAVTSGLLGVVFSYLRRDCDYAIPATIVMIVLLVATGASTHL